MATARRTPDTKISVRNLFAMARDPAFDERELRPYFELHQARSRPFSPALRPNPQTVDDEGLEGDFLIGTFSSLSRARRQWRYRQKIRGGFDGIRIVSEGDSWFQYPILLDDVVDQLFDDRNLAIWSLGAAGDTLAEMVQTDEISAAIRDERPSVFMISGGGNDMVGGGRIATMLHPYDPDLAPEAYLNDAFALFETELADLYRTLFSRLGSAFPALKILCHGYDYVIPGKGGDWLAKPMRSLGIEQPALQREIVRVMIDRLAGVLEGVQARFVGRVVFCDCRGAVTSDDLWDDELHPKDQGFAAVAQRFRSKIAAVVGEVETTTSRVTVLSPPPRRPTRGFMANPTPIAVSTEGRIAARRIRQMTGKPVTARTSVEGVAELAATLEKLHLEPDFLPARFLTDGARRAAAVCRIVTPLNTAGTGFLVARRDLVMTNNHVLPDANVARGSRCEFNFEQGGEPFAVALEPDRLFITDEELDFTIVGCTADGIGEVEPVPLLRDPATVTLNDRVNIIQHPAGRPKEIAIHDNRVVELFEEVVRYRTDTEPGSSGSAVFNNQWDLVALHHSGVAAPDGTAKNEGIRIAKIVAHLLRRAGERGNDSAAARAIIGMVEDTSPFLGFFDTSGVARDREVEVPDTTGLPNFADIGFWNIEHFNDGVSVDRISRVADVLHHLNMDVMGLVEVEDGAMRRLVQELRDRGGAFDFKLLDVGGSQDLAVLFDQDTTTAELANDVLERHVDELARRTPSGRLAFPRVPLFARCHVADVEAQAIEFMLIVVHFKAFGDVESRARRRLAAEVLGRIITDIRDREKLPVVLGGDFNEVLSNDVLSGITDTPDLFTLTADDATSNAASFIGSSRRSLIDHIVVSNDMRLGQIAGDDAAIVRLDKSVRDFADGVSDHVPLVFRIIGRDKPKTVRDGTDGEPGNVINIPEGARRLLVEFG